MLFVLGSNLKLIDKKLFIIMPEMLQKVEKVSAEVQEIHSRFEPQNNVDKQGYYDDLYSKSTVLLPDRDSNPD
jgi:hypothetical protein